MKTKHSKGPWTFHDRGSHFQIQNEGKFPLAEVYGRSAFGRELCEANARLIAAAPDLLVACKDALQTLSTFANEYESESVEAQIAALSVAKLRVAIAKAEGGAA